MSNKTEKIYMKYMMGLLLIALSVGCSNATPEISFLKMPSSNVINPASADSFVQGDVAAASSLKTGDGYTASVIVHAGNNSSTATTADGYTLQIRKLSY